MDVNHDQFVLFNTGQILINIDGYGRFMISLSSINYPNKSYPLITNKNISFELILTLVMSMINWRPSKLNEIMVMGYNGK
ncbi:hypothetical protein DERP_004921 [Dermatophagoides pteronyssinus]|uniref:Uncharacterized protein n=1 Tax=Dermatophagoides pteronyssinus TaxID=6956 RepID=A0ABQ8JSX7_DERPT|nr:hypothetical protein DERP_004921 [Dermatophagoides pteronyssinus]